MTTYTCKCGKTFQSNSNAVTTGNRILRTEFTPDHNCFGCPFVKEVNAEFLECRGTCNIPIYGTTASCVSSKASTLHVSSLDFDFIHDMQEHYNSLGVEDPKDPPYPGMENGSGRYQFSFDFPKNNKGEKAKRELIDYFFEPVQSEESYREMFARKDISGWAERTNLYDKIHKAKEEAKSMNSYYAPCGHKFSRSAGGAAEISVEVTGTTAGCFTCPHGLHESETEDHGPRVMCVCGRKKVEPADTPITLEQAASAGCEEEQAPPVTKYENGGRVYHVGPCDSGKFRTYFYFAVDPSKETVCANIPKCDTAEIAQKMLDDYAKKHGFDVYKEPDLSSDDGSADTAGESECTEPAEQPEQGKTPEIENDRPESDDNTIYSANDDSKITPPPCNWKNASGDDDDEAEEPQSDESLPDGPDLSLRLPAFDAIFNAADDALRDMARTLKTKYIESGELNLKIVIDNFGGTLRPNSKKSKGDCALKPAKVSFPIRFSDDIEFAVDNDGRVIIPDDREHQMSFDEIQPGRVIPPVTTTVDGSTGLVESVDTGESEENMEDSPVGNDYRVDGDDLVTEDGAEVLFSCTNDDCPFFGVDDDENAGCCFDTKDRGDVDFSADVWTAVNMEQCKQPDVLDAYRMNNPEEDYGGSDEPDESDDLLLDMRDNYEEDNSDEN